MRSPLGHHDAVGKKDNADQQHLAISQLPVVVAFLNLVLGSLPTVTGEAGIGAYSCFSV